MTSTLCQMLFSYSANCGKSCTSIFNNTVKNKGYHYFNDVSDYIKDFINSEGDFNFFLFFLLSITETCLSVKYLTEMKQY